MGGFVGRSAYLVASDEVAIAQAGKLARHILARDSGVECSHEEGQSGGGLGVACEHGGVEVGGPLVELGDGDDGAKGVTNTSNTGKFGVGKLSGTESLGEGVGNGNLDPGLDGLNGVRMSGQTDAETIVEKGGMAGLSGSIDVRVLGREEVPVGSE